MDDEGVPPLEDMTDYLQNAKLLNEVKKKQSENLSNNTIKPKPTKTTEHDVIQIKKQVEAQPGKKNESFGGMKKGFLFGSSNSKASKPKPKDLQDNMPFIKPNETPDRLKMPEVEAAMTEGEKFVKNQEWVTDNLLKTVEQNSNLTKKLANPYFRQILDEFQHNPAGALTKYGDNPEVQSFLKDFSAILGSHFTDLAEKQEQQTASKRTDIITKPEGGADIISQDEKKMSEILSRPEVTNVLQDLEVQQLIEQLRNNPDAAQSKLNRCSPEFRRKIQVLVQNGLLQFGS